MAAIFAYASTLSGGGATAVVADPDSPDSAPRSSESYFRAAVAGS